jgi:hypothetical protein
MHPALLVVDEWRAPTFLFHQMRHSYAGQQSSSPPIRTGGRTRRSLDDVNHHQEGSSMNSSAQPLGSDGADTPQLNADVAGCIAEGVAAASKVP